MTCDGGRGTLDACPGTDSAVPTNNGVQYTGVVLDLTVLEDNSLLDTSTRTDSDTGANGNIGTQLGRRVDSCRGVDKDGRNDVVRYSLGKLLGATLVSQLQIQRIGRDGRASSLDLAPEILGLIYKELLAVGKVRENVLFQAQNLLALFLIVIGHETRLEVLGRRVGYQTGAVGSALDGGSDRREDGINAEQVDTTVDQVGNVTLGLLDIVEDSSRVGITDDAAEVGGSVLTDSSAQNDGLGVSVVEELGHLVEGERAADVRVQDEDALGAALEDSIAEVVQTASGAQGLVLAEVLDGQVGEGVGGILDEVLENSLVIVANHDDLLDRRHLGDGRKAVPDNGVTCDIKEGLLFVHR